MQVVDTAEKVALAGLPETCWVCIIRHLDISAVTALSLTERALYRLMHAFGGYCVPVDSDALELAAAVRGPLCKTPRVCTPDAVHGLVAWADVLPFRICGPLELSDVEAWERTLQKHPPPTRLRRTIFEVADTAVLAAKAALPGELECHGGRATQTGQLPILAACCRSIKVHYNPYIDDPSALAGLQHVDLSYCYALNHAAIAALGSVRWLDLAYTNVADVSALANVHSLTLSGCVNVRDVGSLGKVPFLYLRNCLCIDRGFDQLGQGNQLLDLSMSGVAGSVAHLAQVHTLDLSDCKRISTLNGLTQVHTVVLARTDINDLRPVAGAQFVRLSSMQAIFSLRPLASCQCIEIFDCVNISDVSPLYRAREVTLSGLPLVRNVDALCHVWHVSLIGLDSLRSAAALTGCYRLNLSDLPRLKNVSGLAAAVPHLTIKDCPNILHD